MALPLHPYPPPISTLLSPHLYPPPTSTHPHPHPPPPLPSPPPPLPSPTSTLPSPHLYPPPPLPLPSPHLYPPPTPPLPSPTSTLPHLYPPPTPTLPHLYPPPPLPPTSTLPHPHPLPPLPSPPPPLPSPTSTSTLPPPYPLPLPSPHLYPLPYMCSTSKHILHFSVHHLNSTMSNCFDWILIAIKCYKPLPILLHHQATPRASHVMPSSTTSWDCWEMYMCGHWNHIKHSMEFLHTSGFPLVQPSHRSVPGGWSRKHMSPCYGYLWCILACS